MYRRNWPEKDNTWEPYGHVARCRDILEEFEARYTLLLFLTDVGSKQHSLSSRVAFYQLAGNDDCQG